MAAERVYAGLPISERRADRRLHFIRTGIDVFGRNGYANSSISDVCAAGGLSRRQFYEEFSNREDLLVATYDFVQDRAENAVLDALAELSPPIEPAAAATTLLEVYLRSITTAAADARIAFVEVVGVSDRVEQHRQERRTRWAPLINRIIEQVTGPNAHLPGRSEMAATALIGAINSLAHEWSQADPRPPISEVVDVLRAVALGLIA